MKRHFSNASPGGNNPAKKPNLENLNNSCNGFAKPGGSPENRRVNLQEDRRRLPIFSAKPRLLAKLQNLNSVIVIGETGSGKTTQIPQYIYESGLNRKHLIACTQPRRVAAITVAQRVSEETKTELGHLVGYSVRFDDTTSESTKIKYMTDGMLLREAILDPLLKRYSVIVLDEAHERTVHTDVLFGVVKGAQKKRKDRGMFPLKIIVMSATMDVDHFSRYFNNAPVLYIEGRQYPIQVMYSEEAQSDYIFSAQVAVFQIHKQARPNEDILLFLTGQEEIESTVKTIRDVAKDLPSDSPKLIVCPMYAALPQNQQLRIFQQTPQGARKVIVATNIAEASVTIHGIKYVIDSGMVKTKTFNPTNGLSLLRNQRVSKAQAWQRTGRAGREAAGSCYRLYTEAEFINMRTNTHPEIQRCNLASVVLQLMMMGIDDVVNFDFMDKPPKEGLVNAMNQLHMLNAIKELETPSLTAEGQKMAAFPLDPQLSKVLLAASSHGCLEEILTIVSILSSDSVLHNPPSQREEALAARKKFISNEGDHITLLNIYRAFKGVNGNREWCQENFINGRSFKMAIEIRKQLRQISVDQGLKFMSCGRDTTIIRKCLCTGFYMNTAELIKEGEYVTVISRKPVVIHPSSAMFQCKPAYVIYNELVQTNKCYMKDLCVVDPDWLYEVAPTYFKRKLSK